MSIAVIKKYAEEYTFFSAALSSTFSSEVATIFARAPAGKIQEGSTSRLPCQIVPSSPNRLYCAIIPLSSWVLFKKEVMWVRCTGKKAGEDTPT